MTVEAPPAAAAESIVADGGAGATIPESGDPADRHLHVVPDPVAEKKRA
jgi:hypothetical protein